MKTEVLGDRQIALQSFQVTSIGNLGALLRRKLADGDAFPSHAARSRQPEAGEDPQQRRLARAVRADQQRELLRTEIEVQLLEEATFATPYGKLPSAQQHSIRHEQEAHTVERRIVPETARFCNRRRLFLSL